MKDIKDYIPLYGKYLQLDFVKPVYAEHDESKPILRAIQYITDEDAQEVGYDSAKSFLLSNSEYSDNIGLLRPNDFKYLIEKGYDVFGLIPDGLVIDKSKLPTNER